MNPSGGLFERLELIDDPLPRDAALNMAIDEALLDAIAEAPILRIYRWARPAVSFGCFGSVAVVREMFPRRELVRRWTGGGAVEHGEDLTYSLLIPRALPEAALRPEESYRLIHERVAAALERAGVGAGLEAAGQDHGESSHACFASPVRYDVLYNGRKIAGAAQRRTRRGLLHQGSIWFDLPPGNSVPGSELHTRLAQNLAMDFGSRAVRRSLRPHEEEAAKSLALSKYGSAQWTQKF
jgi:lipoate-protein ligase A